MLETSRLCSQSFPMFISRFHRTLAIFLFLLFERAFCKWCERFRRKKKVMCVWFEKKKKARTGKMEKTKTIVNKSSWDRELEWKWEQERLWVKSKLFEVMLMYFEQWVSQITPTNETKNETNKTKQRKQVIY